MTGIFLIQTVTAQAPGTGGESASVYTLEPSVLAPNREVLNVEGDPTSCLISVQRWVPDFPRPIGVPNNVEPSFGYPFVGAVGLTTESFPGTETGHAFQVIDPQTGFVRECNRVPGKCEYGYRDLYSPEIRGYR